MSAAWSHAPDDERPPIPLTEVAAKGGLDPDSLEPHGAWGARVPWRPQARPADRPEPRQVLVTAMTPTPSGVGKTVTTIGTCDALNRIGRRTIATLRQPALGPTLGAKGGAAGGGKARVIPHHRINMGLLGDLDAVGHAQNLLVAAAENVRFNGDPWGLGEAPLLQRRAWHVNDRSLRKVVTHPDGKGDVTVDTGFDLVAACETMAILALTKSPADLRQRLGRMVVAIRQNGDAVTAEDLEVAGAMAVLLRDAINPVLVSTGEGNPVLFQAGPFANVGPGVSGVIADLVARAAADYVVTEAGFGADLGAEKYLDLKVPAGAPWPDCAVLVTTVDAHLQHGEEGATDSLAAGLENLQAHLDILATFNVPVVVAVNRKPTDDAEHVRRILEEAPRRGAASAVESFVFARGGEGGEELAHAVVAAAEQASEPGRAYEPDAPVQEKVEALATKLYGAASVDWKDEAVRDLETCAALGLGTARPCVAKTPASLSASGKLKGRPTGFALPIREVRPLAGAGIVVPRAGAILMLPGLSEKPGATLYDLDPETTAVRYAAE